MRQREKKLLLILGAVFAFCITATLLLLFAGRVKEEGPKEKIFYFTRYDTPADLVLVSIENRTGNVLLVKSGERCIVQGDLSLDADTEAVSALFETAGRLPMKRLVESADASDPQYGLRDPEAEILLQDTKGDGVLFRIGAQTPDSAGYYACLSGDARVFVMSSGDAQPFLKETDRFYDLKLLGAADSFGENLKRITVTREGKTVYSMEAADGGGDVALFTMKDPYPVPLDPGRARDVLLTPLTSLRGIEVIKDVKDERMLGLFGPDNSFTLTFKDGSERRILVGRQDGVKTVIKREEDGLVMTAPTANLSFYYESAMEIAGDTVITAPLGNLKKLVIGGHVYEIGGTAPALTVTLDARDLPLDSFQNGVYTALTRISVLGEWDGSTEAEKPFLTVGVQCGYGKNSEAETTYTFYELPGRILGVSVNGHPAFTCSRSAVEAVIID